MGNPKAVACTQSFLFQNRIIQCRVSWVAYVFGPPCNNALQATRPSRRGWQVCAFKTERKAIRRYRRQFQKDGNGPTNKDSWRIIRMSHPEPHGPPDRTPIRVGEVWENPVTRERATILERPWDNPAGRVAAELNALIGARVVGEHRHPALVEQFTVAGR